MLGAITGFRATVRGLKRTFKLGQDDASATLASILDAFPASDMADW